MQQQKLLHITHITGKGRIIRSVAARGRTETEVELGQYQLELVNLPHSVKTGTILSYMKRQGIPLQGYHRTVTRWGCIMTIGLEDEDERIKAGKILSNRVVPGISEYQPIRVSVKWPVPKGACVRCYHPTNPDKYSMHFRKRGGPACPNQGDVCLTCKSVHHKTRKCGYEMEATYAIARPADKKSVTLKKVKAEPTRLTAKSIKTNQKAAAVSVTQNKGWNTGWNATAAKAPTTRSRSSVGTSRTSTKGAAFSSDEDLPRKSHIKLIDTSPLTQASHEPRSSNITLQ
jgi:hypothetical protein